MKRGKDWTIPDGPIFCEGCKERFPNRATFYAHAPKCSNMVEKRARGRIVEVTVTRPAAVGEQFVPIPQGLDVFDVLVVRFADPN